MACPWFRIFSEVVLVDILRTDRLQLRQAELHDAAHLLALLNEPDFINNIGDRGVRDLTQAEVYLQQNLQQSYQINGFGLWIVERSVDRVVMGLCGLVKRDYLQQPDVGYALFRQYSGQGYTSEAALAVVAYARDVLGLNTLCGIVSPDNLASKRILEKTGMRPAGQKDVPGSDKQVDFYLLDQV
ncbi:MAG: GNAT family N-acetyltransferase [Rheinheimera sp.]|nr:GNAT family N-acetyltransferase [Rheinheimera sp.]